MTEENDIPETNPPPPAEAELRAELERARSGNKILKIAAILLASLFLLMAGAAFYIYDKVARTKAAFEEAFQVPPPPQQGYAREDRALPSSGQAAAGTAMPASTLGLFSGSISGPSPMPFTPQQGEEVFAALSKYENRPIVQEFIADLKKDPDMARAFGEKSKGGNPLMVMSYIQSAKGMEKLVAKYAMRPDFMKLMLEVMKDPALKPLMQSAQGGLPRPGTVGVPPAGAKQPAAPSAGQYGDASMTLDPSAISGTVSPKPAARRAARVPPPVDNE